MSDGQDNAAPELPDKLTACYIEPAAQTAEDWLEVNGIRQLTPDLGLVAQDAELCVLYADGSAKVLFDD